MRLLRLIIAVLLALAIWPASNCCLLAGLMAGSEDACCACDGEAPLEDSCDQCVTLESGVNLAALIPVVAPTPTQREDEAFARLLRKLMEEAATDIAGPAPPAETLSPPPLFAVTLPKALPVRGPSLAA